MDRITFKDVLPQVFSKQDSIVSEVWRQQVVFEKGKSYLLEAESGKGKSTFCAYVLGYRHDYIGQVLFDNIDVSTMKVSDWTYIRTASISHLFQEWKILR